MTRLDALTILLDALESISSIASVDPDSITRWWVDDKTGLVLSEAVAYAPTDTELAEASVLPGASNYTKTIRGIARFVWQGQQVDAFPLMWDAVGTSISRAWAQGAASCGIASDELSLDELIRREMIIQEQRDHILGFLTWVHTHRRDGENKKLWRAIQPRINTWGNAWNKAFNEGKARACANQKLKWLLHGRRVTKVPCVDCKNLNGRIYRASVWARWQVFPQSFQLFCSGFN